MKMNSKLKRILNIMPSQKNITNLADIQNKKAKSKTVFFAHYHGLKSNQINDLRGKIKQVGGEMVVAKNTLLKIAFGKSIEIDNALNGPTATIFSYEDDISPLKVVADYAKENELPTFTAGYLDNIIINADEVVKLSKLPSKQELKAGVVRSISSPLYGIVNVLQGNIRNLVYTLKAIESKKSV